MGTSNEGNSPGKTRGTLGPAGRLAGSSAAGAAVGARQSTMVTAVRDWLAVTGRLPYAWR